MILYKETQLRLTGRGNFVAVFTRLSALRTRRRWSSSCYFVTAGTGKLHLQHLEISTQRRRRYQDRETTNIHELVVSPHSPQEFALPTNMCAIFLLQHQPPRYLNFYLRILQLHKEDNAPRPESQFLTTNSHELVVSFASLDSSAIYCPALCLVIHAKKLNLQILTQRTPRTQS